QQSSPFLERGHRREHDRLPRPRLLRHRLPGGRPPGRHRRGRGGARPVHRDRLHRHLHPSLLRPLATSPSPPPPRPHPPAPPSLHRLPARYPHPHPPPPPAPPPRPPLPPRGWRGGGLGPPPLDAQYDGICGGSIVPVEAFQPRDPPLRIQDHPQVLRPLALVS